MAVEHKIELASVTISDEEVQANYAEEFIVDGELKAQSFDTKVYLRNHNNISLVSGKMEFAGSGLMPEATLSATVGGFDVNVIISKGDDTLTVSDRVASEILTLSGDEGIFSDFDGKHLEFFKYSRDGIPDDDIETEPNKIPVHVENFNYTDNPEALPDDVQLFIKGALSE